MNGRYFQRDAGMVLLEKPKADDHDPAIRDRRIIEAQKFTIGSQEINELQEGEFVIIKDDPQARDWYCAEVRKILSDRIEVNYYTSTTPPLEGYGDSNNALKRKRLREATFIIFMGFLPVILYLNGSVSVTLNPKYRSSS
jgi:hypothetical protein